MMYGKHNRGALGLAVAALCLAPFAVAQKVSSADASFLKSAAQGGTEEVKLGQIAEQTSTNEHIKAFGQRMIEDHTQMGNDLKTLALKKDVALPTGVGAQDRADNNRVSSKGGSQFDRSYIASMVRDHENDLKAFEKEAASGTDPDVKAFASKQLPTLREHLLQAKNIAHELGVTAD